MSPKTNANDSHRIVVLVTKRRKVPYAGYFDGSGAIFIALTLPGGFSGFGNTEDAACKMATARAIGSMKCANRLGLSSSEWFAAMNARLTPALLGLLKSTVNDASKMAAPPARPSPGGPLFVVAPTNDLPTLSNPWKVPA